MKQALHAAAVLAAFLAAAAGQTPTPGTITVASTITATAATVVCVFSAPAKPTIHAACTVGSTAIALDIPTVLSTGTGSGTLFSISDSGNTVTGTFTQASPASVAWALAANGFLQSGTL